MGQAGEEQRSPYKYDVVRWPSEAQSMPTWTGLVFIWFSGMIFAVALVAVARGTGSITWLCPAD